jgi:hypothetical protein
MPKKLRKTLGSVNAPSTVALMELIGTQSKDTIRSWCLNYAEKNMLPIFEKHCPNDMRPRNAINAAREFFAGNVKFLEVKHIILKECHAAARELENDPVAQAAARACGQASSIVHLLEHSLGLYFYGAAAVAYERVGLNESDETYAEIAEEVCADMTNALREIAVKDEPNPAVLRWRC